jgi:hypothetical protein
MRQQLATEIEQELKPPLPKDLRRRLPDIVRLVHRGIYRLFQSSQLRDPENAPVAPHTALGVTVENPFTSGSSMDASADAWLNEYIPMDFSISDRTFGSNLSETAPQSITSQLAASDLCYEEALYTDFLHPFSGVDHQRGSLGESSSDSAFQLVSSPGLYTSGIGSVGSQDEHQQAS